LDFIALRWYYNEYVLSRKTGEQTISLWIVLLCDGITTNMCLAERQENKQSLFGFYCSAMVLHEYVLSRKTGEQTISLWILLLCDGITTNMCLAERQENKQSLFGLYCSAMVLQRICA
jgi:hypothetical protein